MDRKPGSRENKDRVYSILTIPIVIDKIFQIGKKFSPKKLLYLTQTSSETGSRLERSWIMTLGKKEAVQKIGLI